VAEFQPREQPLFGWRLLPEGSVCREALFAQSRACTKGGGQQAKKLPSKRSASNVKLGGNCQRLPTELVSQLQYAGSVKIGQWFFNITAGALMWVIYRGGLDADT